MGVTTLQEKGENAHYQHFHHLPQCFPKPSCFISKCFRFRQVNSFVVWYRVKSFTALCFILIENLGWNTLWVYKKMLVISIFSFFHNVFKRCLSHGHQKSSLCSKGLSLILIFVCKCLPDRPVYKALCPYLEVPSLFGSTSKYNSVYILSNVLYIPELVAPPRLSV